MLEMQLGDAPMQVSSIWFPKTTYRPVALIEPEKGKLPRSAEAKINCIPGPAEVLLNCTAFETPAVGLGFETVSGTMPTVAVPEGVKATIVVVVVGPVVRFWPPSWTVAPGTMPVPLTASKRAEPAVAFVGVTEVICGTGLL